VHDHSVLFSPWHRVCCSSPCCCFRVVDKGRLRRITKVRIDGTMMIETKKWDGFSFREISAGGTSFEDAAGAFSVFTIPRHVTQLTWGRLNVGSRIDKRQGLGCLISCVTRGIICCFTIVSKGRKVVKKRDSTLDFYTKVIIVVCTLVKVYNMKKKNRVDRYRRINHLVIFLVHLM
jgi:hypothetical protein